MSMPYGRRRGRSYTRKVKGKPRRMKPRAVHPDTPNSIWGRIKAAFSFLSSKS